MKNKYTGMKNGSTIHLKLDHEPARRIFITLLFLFFTALLNYNASAQFHQNLAFDGNNDVVDCEEMASVFENTSEFTVEVRVKYNTFTQWGTAFCKRTSDTNRDIVLQSYSTTGQLGVAVANGYGYTTSTLSAGEWHHIAVIYNGNNAEDSSRLKLVIDGVQQSLNFLSTVPSVSPAVPGSHFCLGAEYNGTVSIDGSSFLAVPFNGTMDEVRIWSEAKSLDSITANMNAELTLPQANLAAYYQFNQGSACGDNSTVNTVDDATGNYPGTPWNFFLDGSSSNFTTVVDTSVLVGNITLHANAAPATFQWYDCTSQSIISGQTASDFTPSAIGTYAVIVTQDFCVDTSYCFDIITEGMEEHSPDGRIQIYPNPIHNGDLNFDGITGPATVSIVNSMGELVDIMMLDNKQTTYDVYKLSAGIYSAVISEDGSMVVRKFVVE